MPELPEVETVKRGLEGHIEGQIISDVWCDSLRHLNMPYSTYKKRLSGRKILEVGRRAKLLYFILDSQEVLLFHLKMTGQIIYSKGSENIKGGKPDEWISQGQLPNKFTHLIYTFDSGSVLFFNDVRRFGYAKLLTQVQFKEELDKMELGPEPLDDTFTGEYLFSMSRRFPKRTIKQLILDPKVVTGIGNIYADESLFIANIRPTRKSGKLTKKEADTLTLVIKKVLKKAIRFGGSSISDYVDAKGVKGRYGKYHQVYGRYGKSCYSCSNELKKTVVGGRTSTYCLVCQK